MVESVEQEIRAIIAEVLEVDPATMETEHSLAQLIKVDSVALLEILVTIERRYKINIQESDLKGIGQLDQVIALVKQKLANQAEGCV